MRHDCDIYRAGIMYVAITSRGTTAYAGEGGTMEEAAANIESTPIEVAGPDWRERVWEYVMREDADPVAWADRVLVYDSDDSDARAIEFDVGGWTTISGASCVRVILDPGDASDGDPIRIYTWNNVGPGTPEPVFHGRHRAIATCSTATVPDALLEALQAREDEIREIAATYRGTTWNGSNYVGSWNTDERDCDAFDLTLGELATYWPADEWFGGDSSAVVESALEHDTITAAAHAEIEDAASNDVVLDPDDAENALRGLLETYQEDPDTARATRERIAKLLAAEGAS